MADRTIGWIAEIRTKHGGMEQIHADTKKWAAKLVKNNVARSPLTPGKTIVGRVGKITRNAYGEQSVTYSAVPGVPSEYESHDNLRYL